MTKSIREYRRQPCPICGHQGWCGRTDEGLILCKRPPIPRDVAGFRFKRLASDGTTGLYIEAECGRSIAKPLRSHGAVRPPTAALSEANAMIQIHDRHARSVERLTRERRRQLADQLGLRPGALDVLEIGWWPEQRRFHAHTCRQEGHAGCWTFPECNARSEVIGLGLRWPDGHKSQLAGSKRGLTLPTDWRGLTEPVLIAEGPSDVLAGRSVGLNVLGRPSNNGGATLLAQLCHDRRIVLLAENDRKPDGRWPGRDGAASVARQLERTWGRPVPIAFPPAGVKDLRDWVHALTSAHPGLDPLAIGQIILAAVLPPALLFLTLPSIRRGHAVVRVFRWADGSEARPIHCDQFALHDASARQRFAKAVARAEPAAEVDELARRLLALETPRQDLERSATCSMVSSADASSEAVPTMDSTANGHKPIVLLPAGAASITQCAEQLGNLLAGTATYFVRGGQVVTVARDDSDQPLLAVLRPAALASAIESVATLMKHGRTGNQRVARAAICTEQQARLIVHAGAFLGRLPALRLISQCPLLIEREGRLVQVSGYDRASGILASGKATEEVALPEAVRLLTELLEDFRFATPADRARALAALVTPALVLGGQLGGRAPVDVGEADASQAGKGFRNRLTGAIYNHPIRIITQKKGGVGSLEESFAAALIRGSNFIAVDNVRGSLDSPAIESFLTEDAFLARVPHSAAVEIDPRRVILQITSNKADITVDLANRASCVRILRQPEGYPYRRYVEGDILDHVRANQPTYLGAVFAVVQAWFEAGRPRTAETRHAFRAWAQTLDWIVQHLFQAGPLLEGHRETQTRMASPMLNWLRDLALAVRNAGRAGQWLRANQLVEIMANAPAFEIPGLPSHGDWDEEENRKRVFTAVGRRLQACFGTQNLQCVDGFQIERVEEYDSVNRRPVRAYRFAITSRDTRACAHAPGRPVAEGRSMGATPLEVIQDEVSRDLSESDDQRGSASCAHAAPISALMTVPPKPHSAPMAPIDSVMSDEDTRIPEPNGATRADRDEAIAVIAHHGRMGAMESKAACHNEPGELNAEPMSAPPRSSTGRSARRYRWVSADVVDLPEEILALVQARAGWQPDSWAVHLSRLAESCREVNPGRSRTLQAALGIMAHSGLGLCPGPADGRLNA